MNTYDLLVLAPSEFEDLTRDLLQKKLEIFIESFTTGRDQGVDMRYANGKSRSVVIQAKRYEEYSDLKKNLKKEVVKVKALSPSKYVLSTTVGLTPRNKEEIMEMFSPYILSTEDILGKNDLNNLIGTYSDVEKKYYKLWLSSTNILEKIIHSKIYNQSQFELDTIKDQMKLYVQNDSFKKAIDIVNENKYVIISGIPGIGKTTLSRVLVNHMLVNGAEEFVCINNSIEEGYEYYKEEKSQVFFFDDFFGTNFLKTSLHANAGKSLVRFIEKIKTSKNKIFILATREYILSQAKSVYEEIGVSNIEIAKCTLDLGVYTKKIRAQILCNHFYFSGVPVEYLQDLTSPKKHMKIINHVNYNPRIIEVIVKERVWSKIHQDEFASTIVGYLDNPESVWLHAFENSIEKLSQHVLLVLLTVGTPVKMEDLYFALQQFLYANDNNERRSVNYTDYKKSLKELENTFIRTHANSHGESVVEYQNPSIQDFLANYLKKESGHVVDLIKGIVFKEQIFSMFTIKKVGNGVPDVKVVLSEKAVAEIVNVIVNRFENLKNCAIRLQGVMANKEFIIIDRPMGLFESLRMLYSKYATYSSAVLDVVVNKFWNNLYNGPFAVVEQRAYLDLLPLVIDKKSEINVEMLIESFFVKVSDVYSLVQFSKLGDYFPDQFNQFIDLHNLPVQIEDIVMREVEGLDEDTDQIDLVGLMEEIQYVEQVYNANVSEFVDQLQEKIDYYNDNQDYSVDYYEDEKGVSTVDDENKEIEELFRSIVDV